MQFKAKPQNCFKEFISKYYSECRARFPKIEAIAGKWRFEDLIPGLSDFDSRFICSNGMTIDDWCEMSDIVGEVHLDICRKHPEWTRTLEHLPGINLTWDELASDLSYYPEYLQWTFYDCDNDTALRNVEGIFQARKWDRRDEYFHLKKFITYFGPYNRSIDPAVNLGPYENKYPLHSRIMHYFNPPVKSAVSLIMQRNIVGKAEAFQIAKSLFPDIGIFDRIFDIVEKHYEVPELYEEPYLLDFEGELFETLKIIKEYLDDSLIPASAKKESNSLKEYLGSISIPQQLLIFENVRFSRLMKGRLHFYANAPAHFENIFLIQNELKRIGNYFFKTPYSTYWQIITGEKADNPELIVPKLSPGILIKEEVDATLEFSRLTPGFWKEGEEVELALKIAGAFDCFYKGLYKILTEVENLSYKIA